MPLVAGIAPDGGLIRILPKAAPVVGVKTVFDESGTIWPAPGTPGAPGTVDAKGLVVARFAQLNVVDSDGDITVTGAIGSGQDVVISAWSHGSWEKGLAMLPAGTGRITEEAGWLVLRGRFLMDTIAGRETFLTVKGLGPRCEWSYAYQVPESDFGYVNGQRVRYLRKLAVTECSAVLRGAGIGTHSVEVAGMDPTQLMFANAEAANAAALLALQGYGRGKRRIIGHHPTDGNPVYAASGGRK